MPLLGACIYRAGLREAAAQFDHHRRDQGVGGTPCRQRGCAGDRGAGAGHPSVQLQVEELACACNGRYAGIVRVPRLHRSAVGGNSLGCMSVTSCPCPAAAFACSGPCLRAAAGPSCTSTRSRTSAPGRCRWYPVLYRSSTLGPWGDVLTSRCSRQQQAAISVRPTGNARSAGPRPRKLRSPHLRVHDLRHTAVTVWIGAGADAKVVQRILGHATATMTLDLYGHLVDTDLWDAAVRSRRQRAKARRQANTVR